MTYHEEALPVADDRQSQDLFDYTYTLSSLFVREANLTNKTIEEDYNEYSNISNW